MVLVPVGRHYHIQPILTANLAYMLGNSAQPVAGRFLVRFIIVIEDGILLRLAFARASEIYQHGPISVLVFENQQKTIAKINIVGVK
jgi:hypothetical protein